MKSVIELFHISKNFKDKTALNDVSLAFHPGEIHSLVGENGAGKTTLVHIISGLIKPDSGHLAVMGRPWSSLNYMAAGREGITIIQQDLKLPEKATVAEYLYMGREPRSFGVVKYREMLEGTREVLDSLMLSFRPDDIIGRMNLAHRRMIAIARAVVMDPRVLILDEATTQFSSADEEKFIRLLNILRDEGKLIIHISHKLDEVMHISDRVSILRNGHLVASTATDGISRDELIAHMIGRRESRVYYWKPHFSSNEPVLEVKGLELGRRIRDVSLTVKSGEVVGLAGLVGSGRTTLARTLYGMLRPTSGTVYLAGRAVRFSSPMDARSAGIAMVSDDRHRYGIFPRQTVGFNLTLGSLASISWGIIIRRLRERAAVSDALERYWLSRRLSRRSMTTLSGGIQQKIAFARSTTRMPRLLIVDEPTKEIDLVGRDDIYAIINNLARQGVAVILISSVMSELINNSDRILVMKSGTVVKSFRKTEFNEEMIMHYAIDSREVRA